MRLAGRCGARGGPGLVGGGTGVVVRRHQGSGDSSIRSGERCKALVACTGARRLRIADPRWLDRGTKVRLHSFNPETGNFTLLYVVEPHAPNNRLNDGFVDSEGFLWFGSMDDNEEEPSGALYQLGDEGCIRRDPGYVVTNGPAESPDGKTLYHTDTLAGIIYAFDRTRLGSLTHKRIFVRLPPGGGYPDGPS